MAKTAEAAADPILSEIKSIKETRLKGVSFANEDSGWIVAALVLVAERLGSTKK